MMVIKVKDAHVELLDKFCVQMIMLLLSLCVKVKNWAKFVQFVKFSIISCVVKFYAN